MLAGIYPTEHYLRRAVPRCPAPPPPHNITPPHTSMTPYPVFLSTYVSNVGLTVWSNRPGEKWAPLMLLPAAAAPVRADNEGAVDTTAVSRPHLMALK